MGGLSEEDELELPDPGEDPVELDRRPLVDQQPAGIAVVAPRRELAPVDPYSTCEACRLPLFPDFFFCLRCGATSREVRERCVLLLHFGGSDGQRLTLARALARVLKDKSVERIARQLRRGRMLLRIDVGPSERALLFRVLGDHGATATLIAADERGYGSALAGELVRRPEGIANIMGAAGAFALGLGWASIGGAGVFAALLARQAWVLAKGPRLKAADLSTSVRGLDPALLGAAQAVLRRLDDPEVRRCLGVCLVEHDALVRLIQRSDAPRQSLLARIRPGLEQLVGQVVSYCRQFAELATYTSSIDVAALSQELPAIDESDDATRAARERTKEQRAAQLSLIERMTRTKVRLHSQLVALAASLETLRARVHVLVVVEPGERESQAMDRVLGELQDETRAIEATLAELAGL